MDTLHQKGPRELDPTIRETFGALSQFYAEIFYVYLYGEGLKMYDQRRSEGVRSITDGYRHALTAFITGIDKNTERYKAESYVEMLKGVHAHYCRLTRFKSVTPSETLTNIAACFVPVDYRKNLTADEVRGLVRDVLVKSIKEFAVKIVRDMLHLVIDDHDNRTNVELFKEEFHHLLVARRQEMMSKFFEQLSGVKKTARTELDVRVRAHMQKLQDELNGALTRATQFEHLYKTQKTQLLALIESYKALQAENQAMRAALSRSADKPQPEPRPQERQPERAAPVSAALAPVPAPAAPTPADTPIRRSRKTARTEPEPAKPVEVKPVEVKPIESEPAKPPVEDFTPDDPEDDADEQDADEQDLDQNSNHDPTMIDFGASMFD